MAWTGFVSESKRFCSYANKAPTQKLAWWWALVFDAGPKFYFYTLRDWWQMRHVRRRNSKAAVELIDKKTYEAERAK